jgi:hypothetical protein
MDSLYIIKEFVDDDLQSAVQLPTMVSSSCEWKSKNLAVAQSHMASSQRREGGREGEREKERERERERERETSFFQCHYIVSSIRYSTD